MISQCNRMFGDSERERINLLRKQVQRHVLLDIGMMARRSDLYRVSNGGLETYLSDVYGSTPRLIFA